MIKNTNFPTLFEEKGLDDLFEGFFRPIRHFGMDTGELMPAMDVTETDEAILVKAEMPGIKKEDIDISIQNGMLTVSGESKEEREEKKEGRVIRQERRYGRYTRSMNMGDNIDGEHISAEYKDGVLEITLPKLAVEETKKIKVDVH